MTAASTRQFDAEVIAAFGRHLLVRDGRAGVRARPSGRRLCIVCGDRVRCNDHAHDEVLVVEVLPRSTCWRAPACAATASPWSRTSRSSWSSSRRCRSRTSSSSIATCARPRRPGSPGAMAVNKSDLGANKLAPEEIAALTAAGYAHVACSAKQGQVSTNCARCSRAR